MPIRDASTVSTPGSPRVENAGSRHSCLRKDPGDKKKWLNGSTGGGPTGLPSVTGGESVADSSEPTGAAQAAAFEFLFSFPDKVQALFPRAKPLARLIDDHLADERETAREVLAQLKQLVHRAEAEGVTVWADLKDSKDLIAKAAACAQAG